MSPAMSHREVGCSADGKVYSMACRMAHSMVRLEKDSLDSVLVGILWTIYIQIKKNQPVRVGLAHRGLPTNLYVYYII